MAADRLPDPEGAIYIPTELTRFEVTPETPHSSLCAVNATGHRGPCTCRPVSAAVSPAAPRCEVHTFATTDKCGCDGRPPVAAAVSPAEPPEEDCDERIARLRAAATDVRLRDAQTVGALLDDAVEALEAAYAELGRAEDHHRWHHEQEGREVEPDEERMRVLMVIAEALDSLGANDA